MQTHPNCDKRLFTEESAVGLKAPERPFPLNSDQGVLKYRLATTDDTLVPISSMFRLESVWLFSANSFRFKWLFFLASYTGP